MKLNRLATVLTLGLALTTLVATGCKKQPNRVTDLPASRAGATTPTRPTTTPGGPSDPTRGNIMLPPDNPKPTETVDLKPPPDEPIAQPARGSHEGWTDDPTALATESIHFAFDSATIRSDDKLKLDNVATYLKTHPTHDLRVEGNCDKRGTEGYNMALGERRALAAREQLVGMGIAPERIETRSYGEDRPVDPAENDAAYAKNRRDDFIVLIPPTAK